MELDLYNRFFDKELAENAYENGFEYMEDLYQMLDAYLVLEFETIESQEGGKTPVHYNYAADEFRLIRKHINRRLEMTPEVEKIPFAEFSRRLRLTEFQKFCLILGSAVNMDSGYGERFAYLQKNPNMQYPSKGFAIRLFERVFPVQWEEYLQFMAHSGFYKLYFMHPPKETAEISWMSAALCIRPELRLFFYYDNSISKELSACVKYYDGIEKPKDIIIYKEQFLKLLNLEAGLQKKDFAVKCTRVIHLVGEKGSGKKFLLKHLAYEAGKGVIFVNTPGFLEKWEEMGEELSDILQLELILKDSYLCFYGFEGEEQDFTEKGKFVHLVQQLLKEGISIFITSAFRIGGIEGKYRSAQIEFPLLEPSQKRKMWDYFVKDYRIEADINTDMLANRYVLNAGGMKRALQSAHLYAQAEKREEIAECDMIRAVKEKNQNMLGKYARPVKTVYTWEDLVVSPSVRLQLKHICNQMKYRSIVGEEWGFYEKRPYGRGVCALFYGASGTGKTMAAQVLANELGLELFRIDMSRMISKYIGETEKHISDLFERAKYMNALLFFDEAEAFFSKRMEVTDANDRKANGDVAHLLQQIEEYEGIALLATNLKDSMDQAFIRRIRFMVNFEFPEAEIRKQIWKRAVPEKALLAERLDTDFYAEKFELSGSEIKEILWNAAFMAAAESQGIANRHIEEALKLCMAKYGKVLSREDFEG